MELTTITVYDPVGIQDNLIVDLHIFPSHNILAPMDATDLSLPNVHPMITQRKL